MSQLNGHVDNDLREEDTIDLTQYWQTIRPYLWRVFGLATLVSILVTLVVLSITPQYTATATILIEADQAKVLSIEEVYGLDSSRDEYFQTQYEILKSRQIAQKVVEKLKLYQQPTFDPEYKNNQPGYISKGIKSIKAALLDALSFLPQDEVEIPTEEQILAARKRFAVDKFIGAFQVNPVSKTQLVNLSYEHESAQLAALIANTVGEVYIENYLQAKLDMTAKATTWLNDSLQGLRIKLDTTEKNLSDFYEREQLVNIKGIVGLASDELQQLSELLLEAQGSLKRTETIYQQVNTANVDIATLAALPEVLNDLSIQDVKRAQLTAQSRVSELSKVYGPKHPKMITANAELDSIGTSLVNQIKVLVKGINTEYVNALAKVKVLKSDVEKAKQEYRKLSKLDNERKTLQREVDINQQLYNTFFTRLKETGELGGFESANARILDEAIPPKYPSKPKKGLIIAVAFLFSFGLGVFLVLTLDGLNSGIRSVDDVEKKLGQRMLGIIPWQEHDKKKNMALRLFFDAKQHMFGEAVRTLRTSLQLLNMNKPAKTILVTSSAPKEGKSTVSINLAFAMGQLNTVLLIDTDLRRPSLASQFSLPGFQPGLANLITGTHTIEECVVTDEVSGIDLICAGTLPHNPQELLASDAFVRLIKGLKDKYDQIVMDSAPTQAVSDAIIVSQVCDSVVYVVKSDSTSVKMINNGLSRFIQTGHRVDGVVLNQVDMKKAKKSGQYTGYYDQYGYQRDSTALKST
jgi:succinoglycan biosynthesis transport protein ExoP